MKRLALIGLVRLTQDRDYPSDWLRVRHLLEAYVAPVRRRTCVSV